MSRNSPISPEEEQYQQLTPSVDGEEQNFDSVAAIAEKVDWDNENKDDENHINYWIRNFLDLFKAYRDEQVFYFCSGGGQAGNQGKSPPLPKWENEKIWGKDWAILKISASNAEKFASPWPTLRKKILATGLVEESNFVRCFKP